MSIAEIIISGLRGFAIFFSITLIVEFFSFSMGFTNSFNIDVIDFYNSLLGIALFSLITITRHIIGEEQ